MLKVPDFKWILRLRTMQELYERSHHLYSLLEFDSLAGRLCHLQEPLCTGRIWAGGSDAMCCDKVMDL